MSHQKKNSDGTSQTEKKSTTTDIENEIPLTRRPPPASPEKASQRDEALEPEAPTSQSKKGSEGTVKPTVKVRLNPSRNDAIGASSGEVSKVESPQADDGSSAPHGRFLEDELKVIRAELSTMPQAAAICIFSFQLLGVWGILGGVGILAFLWTAVWCCVSCWVGYPLAQALKLENRDRIGPLASIPLYGPIVIWKLANRAKSVVSP